MCSITWQFFCTMQSPGGCNLCETVEGTIYRWWATNMRATWRSLGWRHEEPVLGLCMSSCLSKDHPPRTTAEHFRIWTIWFGFFLYRNPVKLSSCCFFFLLLSLSFCGLLQLANSIVTHYWHHQVQCGSGFFSFPNSLYPPSVPITFSSTTLFSSETKWKIRQQLCCTYSSISSVCPGFCSSFGMFKRGLLINTAVSGWWIKLLDFKAIASVHSGGFESSFVHSVSVFLCWFLPCRISFFFKHLSTNCCSFVLFNTLHCSQCH